MCKKERDREREREREREPGRQRENERESTTQSEKEGEREIKTPRNPDMKDPAAGVMTFAFARMEFGIHIIYAPARHYHLPRGGGFRVENLGYKFEGLGFRVEGLGFRVEGFDQGWIGARDHLPVRGIHPHADWHLHQSENILNSKENGPSNQMVALIKFTSGPHQLFPTPMNREGSISS